MLVRELMTSPVVSVHQEEDAAHAVAVLDRMNVTCLPVVDSADRIVGLIGEADVIRQVVDAVPGGSHHVPQVVTHVRDVMTRNVLTIHADAQVPVALALMNGTGLKSLPVVLHDRVVGMLSRRDIVRALARGDLEVG
jgi:CBS domain-containing protein